MKLKLKSLVAVMALAVAGVVQAAPVSIDGYTSFDQVGLGNGSGQIIFSVIDPVANLSLIMNTGLTVNDFRNNNASLINVFSTTDAGLQSFFSTNAADLSQMRWNMGAISNGPDVGPNAGILSTNGSQYDPNSPFVYGPLNAGSLQNAMSNIANYATVNAFFLSGSNSAVSAANSGTGHNGSNTWGPDMGSQLSVSNERTGFSGGQTMSFYSFDPDAVNNVDLPSIKSVFTAGEWKVDTSLGRLSYVSAVPVPAAVWLFGSGLVGLVGVARRRKSA